MRVCPSAHIGKVLNGDMVLQVVVLLADRSATVIWDETAFNPDLEGTELTSVIMISHGVPGSLKDALDWIVGSGELVDKPVARFQQARRRSFCVLTMGIIVAIWTLPLAGEHIKRNRRYRHHGASVTIFGVLDDAQNQVFSITGS